jgi:hypothetical protein
MRLDRTLRFLGYSGEADAFRDGVVESFQLLYPAWSDEQLLHNPAEGQRFCSWIRERFQIDCNDELVLRVLTNSRKNPGRRKASA